MIDPSTVPTTAGCYLFKDANRRIIYIGKAKNLRKRVKSYFQKDHLDPKTQRLVESIAGVDFIVTDNEVEALILENTLIKKHQPKYNIDLKDSKNYAYIQVTDEDFSRLLIARKKTGKGWFYGPFVSGQERDYVLHVLNKTFGLRRCKRLPKRACLRFQIGLCSAPCIREITSEDYQDRVQMARLVLKGKVSELIQSLKEEMDACSSSLKFERAVELRNRIEALSGLKERQKMDRQKRHDEVIVNFVVRDGRVYLLLFKIYRGTLTNKEEFSFNYSPDFFEEFLIQYYSENKVPKELILPQKTDLSVVDFLSMKRKGKVKISVPHRGEKKKLLLLVKKNIEASFFGDFTKLEELKETLGLDEKPHIIECIDISHLSGTSTVGSMVQYRGAKPDKSNYRRFKIKSVEGVDDTAAIAEVVRRRYKRLKKERTKLPNLIIIDGGSGQLNAAKRALQDLELHIPLIAIAKRFESIYLLGQALPLRLDNKNKALQFIREIRDEAHRFAIKYNRLLRKKELMK